MCLSVCLSVLFVPEDYKYGRILICLLLNANDYNGHIVGTQCMLDVPGVLKKTFKQVQLRIVQTKYLNLRECNTQF